MVFPRDLDFAITIERTISIDHDDIAKNHVDFGVGFEEGVNALQCAGQILFIAIQVSEQGSGCFAKPAIYRVVHTRIFLDERLDAGFFGEEFLSAIVGAGFLHDVFMPDTLIRDGIDAQLQPFRTSKARSDN